jgi:hypothetical protein
MAEAPHVLSGRVFLPCGGVTACHGVDGLGEHAERRDPFHGDAVVELRGGLDDPLLLAVRLHPSATSRSFCLVVVTRLASEPN